MTIEFKPIIAIVGTGKVGLALAALFSSKRYEVRLGVKNITSINPIATKLANSRENISITDNAGAVDCSSINILAVDDQSIEAVCDSLINNFKPDSIIAHCSGALDSLILSNAQKAGHPCCSLHPLNTFPTIESALELFVDPEHKTSLYCEGDDTALGTCIPMFEQLGFIPVEISREAKPLYHAACVFACNYLVSLMELSLLTAESAGLDRDEFWKSLQPLIQTTLTNISKNGTTKALSGPIARGDAQIASNHLQALSEKRSGLQNSYRDLGRHALTLAVQRGDLSDELISELKQIFN